MPITSDQMRTYSIKVKDEQLKIEETSIAPEKNVADGIVVGDLWGYISDVNEVIVKMYDAKDKSEFVGKHVLDFLVKGEKDRAIESSLYVIAVGQPKKQAFLARLKNGKEIMVEVTSGLVKNKQGETIGFIDFVSQIDGMK